MRRYWNKEFRFKFEYSENDWEASEIEGENSGVELSDKRGLKGDSQVIVRGWFNSQWFDDYVIMEIGNMRWVEHPQYGKCLEVYFNQKDFVVSFLLTGGMDRALVEEFKRMTGTYEEDKQK